MRHLYMGDRRHIIGLTIHWTMLKNILWIMAKAFKYIKIRCIIIFLLVFGFFLEMIFYMEKYTQMWSRLLQHTEKNYIKSNDTFHAPESRKNIPEWYISLKRNIQSCEVKSLKLFYLNTNKIHTNI